jgi:membrane-associated phospholipid phosphatase
MNHASSQPVNRRAVALFVLLSVAGFFVIGQFDMAVYHVFEGRHVGDSDLIKMFRVMGFLGTWLLAAAALALVDGAWRRALLLLSAPVAAGIVGEVLKQLIRRTRPMDFHGEHHSIPWSEFHWSTSHLSAPSSHAIVAFGAAWLLCRLFPRATPVWLTLATGCAATRVIVSAHFVSDVFLSAVAGYAVVWLIWRTRWAQAATPAAQ